MIYIQSAFSQEEQRLELVGRQGEGGTRQLVFDCADVLAEYPDALIVCAMQRAGDRTAYLKDCATAGTNRAVTLESADVAVPGVLKIELRALIGDDVRKSAVYIAKVAESLRGAQDRPGNPIADVLNRIDMTISRAEESIAEADAAAKSAREVADTVQAKLDNGDFVGPAGKPGSDASVTAENIQSALGYTPGKALTPEDHIGQIENLFPDKITVAVNEFCRYGNVCQFAWQFFVPETMEFDYGTGIAKLPFASAMRCWLNNSTDFYIDRRTPYIRRNGTMMHSGHYALSGIYISEHKATREAE